MKKKSSSKMSLSVIRGEEMVFNSNDSKTLGDILIEAAKDITKGVIYVKGDGTEDFQSYDDLYKNARIILSNLHTIGIRARDKIIIELMDDKEFFSVFWACVIGGIIAVPVMKSDVFVEGKNENDKNIKIWELLDRPAIITNEVNKKTYHNKLTSQLASLTIYCYNEISKGEKKLRSTRRIQMK